MFQMHIYYVCEFEINIQGQPQFPLIRNPFKNVSPFTSLMQAGVVLLLPFLTKFLTMADPDPDRGAKRGFREKIRCIDNGKFYRNPNTPRDLAFRKVFFLILVRNLQDSNYS